MTLYSSDPRFGAIGGPAFGASASAPAGIGPSPVDLGLAGNFAIFADTGIANATFPATIVGDMGVGPGVTSTAITGPWSLVLDGSGAFSTSAQVLGKIYAHDYAAPTPAYVTTASIDVLTAYNDAAGRAGPNFTNLGAGNVDGLTLAPGLYKWTTGVTLDAGQTLTFNGGPNDTWILQVGGVLATGANSDIVLTGGAQAKNIVWQVSGGVTIGANAHFEGIILSATTINLGHLASANSRLLAQTAVNIDASIVLQTASAITPPSAASFVPFIVYARIVPVIASGRRREYSYDMEKKAQAVEDALLSAGFTIATPVAFTPTFRQAPARLTIVGFWPDTSPVLEPLIPLCSVIHSGTVEGEQTAVLHPPNGTQTWGDLPTAQNMAQTKALKAEIETIVSAIPFKTWAFNIFYMDVASVKYGQLPNKKGFFSFPQ